MRVRIYEQMDGEEVLVRDGRYPEEAVEHFGNADENAAFDATCEEVEGELKRVGRAWLNKGRYLLMVDRTN